MRFHVISAKNGSRQSSVSFFFFFWSVRFLVGTGTARGKMCPTDSVGSVGILAGPGSVLSITSFLVTFVFVFGVRIVLGVSPVGRPRPAA